MKHNGFEKSSLVYVTNQRGLIVRIYKRTCVIAGLFLAILSGSSPAQSKPVDDALKQAQQLIEAGRYGSARDACSRAIELDSKNSEAYQMRGWIEFCLGRPNNGLINLDQAIKLNPNRYENYTTRGLLLRELSKYDESRRDLDKAIKIDPNNPIAYYLRGLSCLLQGLHIRARQDFTEAIKRGKNHTQLGFAYYWRGRTQEMQDNCKSAVEDFSIAIKLNPDTNAASKTHMNPQIIDMFSRNENRTSALGLLERGLCYSQLGEHVKAIADLTEVIKTTPKETLLYEKRGSSYLFLGQYNEAIKDFNKALLRGSESADVYFQLGLTHFCLKKYQNAAADFNAWINRTFWEDDSRSALAASLSYLSFKRTKQDASARRLSDDAAKGMAKANGWLKSVPLLLKGQIPPDKLVSMTESKPLKDRTQCRCYAALYLLSQNKPKEAQKHLNWILAQGDKRLHEYTVSAFEASQLTGPN